MNPRSHAFANFALALTLMLGAALAGCASEPTLTTAEMAQRIEAARTPADHEAIAAYYAKEAAAARSSSDSHRKMARAYQAQIGQRGGASMVAHCNAIVRSQEAIAADYEAMATTHRDLAQQVRP